MSSTNKLRPLVFSLRRLTGSVAGSSGSDSQTKKPPPSDEDIQECLFKGKSNCSTLIKDVNEAKTPEAETPKAKPMRSRSSSRAADSSKQTTDPTKYNTPEYFQYNSYSYYDIDASMGKFRLAQPNKFDPLVPKK